MNLTFRPYLTENDFWRMRDFLRQVFLLNDRLERSWHAAYQRRGLSKALMNEGLRRVQRMGATLAFVGGYSPEANALYRAVMGSDHE